MKYTDDGKINVSPKGIDISYRRFVSDSAPGLIFIAIIIFIYFIYLYNDIPQGVITKNLPLSDLTKTSIYIMLFVISTPIGLAINVASSCFIDKWVHKIENIFFSRWESSSAAEEFQLKKCEKKGCKDMWCANICKGKSKYPYNYLFSWDNFQGSDYKRLREFLKKKFDINWRILIKLLFNQSLIGIFQIPHWIETAEIKEEDGVIKVFIKDKKNFLSLRLNNEKTKVNIEIDYNGIQGFYLPDELIAKMENGKLNIYAYNEPFDIGNWIGFTNCIIRMMDIYYYNQYENHNHELAAHVFLRNLAFISISVLFIDAILYIFNKIKPANYPTLISTHDWAVFLMVLISIVIFLFYSAYVGFYYRIALLRDAYTLSLKDDALWDRF